MTTIPTSAISGIKKLLLPLFLLFLANPLAAQTVDDLVIVTEEYPPYNFTTDGVRQGISTDLLIEMLKLTNSKLTREDIGFLPWARAFNLAFRKQNALLFSTTYTESRKAMFKWVGPILSSEFVLFAKKGKGLQLSTITDINKRKLRIGVVLHDVGEQMLLEQGVKRTQIYRYNKNTHMVDMLYNERIDLLAYGQIASRWVFKQQGYNPDEFEEVIFLQPSDYYFALNKETDDVIVNQLQEAFDQLKKNGRVAEIISSYLD